MLRILVPFLLLILAGCEEQPTSFNFFKKQLPQTLVVLSRNAPTTWYEGRDGLEGPEYDLIKSFTDFHGISFRIENADSISEVLQRLKQGDAHIAAAGLTITDERIDQGINFGPEYLKVEQQVVCRRGNGTLPRKIADLEQKNIHVIANSSYVERLQQLKTLYPNLTWQEVEDTATEQLLEKVWLKEIDCTVADSNIVSINRRYFPELVIAFSLSDEQSLAWVILDEWKHIKTEMENWLEDIEKSGELASILEKYYGHVELYDYVDMRKFISRIKKRLPKYKADFLQAAEKKALDWTLVAAQSYQESHWNSKAKSPTGVRGIMMLTQTTAKSVGVHDRLDAKQNIKGGVKYLARLLERIPQQVEGENRIWYALAAYNVGFGHLKDAMSLAEKMGKDAAQWVELKTVLPLLAKKKYYKDLIYGYARGAEPVRYVQRIRDYQQVLQQHLSVDK
jgi:membrane-bound lytic murein transglycosylase F